MGGQKVAGGWVISLKGVAQCQKGSRSHLASPSSLVLVFQASSFKQHSECSLPYLPFPLEHIINIWSNKLRCLQLYTLINIFPVEYIHSDLWPLSLSTWSSHPSQPPHSLTLWEYIQYSAFKTSKWRAAGMPASSMAHWTGWFFQKADKRELKSWTRTDWLDLFVLPNPFLSFVFCLLLFSISAGSRVSGCRCTPLTAVLPWQPQSPRKAVWRDMKHRQTIFCRGLDLYASHIIRLFKPIEQDTLT